MGMPGRIGVGVSCRPRKPFSADLMTFTAKEQICGSAFRRAD